MNGGQTFSSKKSTTLCAGVPLRVGANQEWNSAKSETRSSVYAIQRILKWFWISKDSTRWTVKWRCDEVGKKIQCGCNNTVLSESCVTSVNWSIGTAVKISRKILFDLKWIDFRTYLVHTELWHFEGFILYCEWPSGFHLLRITKRFSSLNDQFLVTTINSRHVHKKRIRRN